MDHPFVSVLERELLIRKEKFSVDVRTKRMSPELARKEYDKMEAAFKFMQQCQLRYAAENAYDPSSPSLMKVTEDMAKGDREMRSLWNTWAQKET